MAERATMASEAAREARYVEADSYPWPYNGDLRAGLKNLNRAISGVSA
jgi:hypothetical protein